MTHLDRIIEDIEHLKAQGVTDAELIAGRPDPYRSYLDETVLTAAIEAGTKAAEEHDEGGLEDYQEAWVRVGVRAAAGTIERYVRDVIAARVDALCDAARVSLARGCLCYADSCTGKCGPAGKPLAWDLDPADVRRAVRGEE